LTIRNNIRKKIEKVTKIDGSLAFGETNPEISSRMKRISVKTVINVVF
jgi:hypothetical protein